LAEVVALAAGLDRTVVSEATLPLDFGTSGTAASSCSVSVTGSELGSCSATFLLLFVGASAALAGAAAGFLTTVARVALLVGGALTSTWASDWTTACNSSVSLPFVVGSALAMDVTAAVFRFRAVVAGLEVLAARLLLLMGLAGTLMVSSASIVDMGSSVSLGSMIDAAGFLVVRRVVLAADFVDFVDFVVREAGLSKRYQKSVH